MSLYDIGRIPVLGYFRFINRVEILGAENVPKQNGLLICSNHLSNLDPFLIGIACPRDIHYMAKESLFRIPLVKSLLPIVHAFPVRRGLGDRQAIRSGLKILESGKVMGLFPEGRRMKN